LEGARLIREGSAVELRPVEILQFPGWNRGRFRLRRFRQETTHMADRNRSDLDREQRGSSNPNQSQDTENRSTQSTETGMGGSSKGSQGQNQNRGEGESRDKGIGSETEDRGQGNVGSSRESGTRPSSIEGDENLNRR
jgi:hypothetical protein